MTKTALVKKTIEMIESGKINERFFADNLVVEGMSPSPLNKSQYMEFLDKLTSSIPDLSYNCREIKIKQGDTVSAKVKISGTNTNQFDIPDIPTHPATGMKFRLPQEVIEFEIQNNRIARVTMQENYECGVNGIINQLGIIPY